jgi:RNA polymerase-binding transcription factor DksA
MDVPEPAPAALQAAEVDLAAIAADLADVEVALARLDAGTYFTDEVTGQPLFDELLAAHPTARRAPSAPAPAPTS